MPRLVASREGEAGEKTAATVLASAAAAAVWRRLVWTVEGEAPSKMGEAPGEGTRERLGTQGH